MADNMLIGCAPKDGTVIYIYNRDKGFGMVGFWNSKSEQWEGEILGVLGVIKIRWDKEDAIQPTHWRNT